MRAINGALCFVAWLAITKILGHVRTQMQAITQTHICLQLQELLLYSKHMCKGSDGVVGKDDIS